MTRASFTLVVIALCASTLAACGSPRKGGGLGLCITSDADTVEEGRSDAIIEREGLRVVSEEERATPELGIGCGQTFELVDDSGFHVWFGFIVEYGENDELDDEADIAPRLEIPAEAVLSVRLDPRRSWTEGPSIYVADEQGILVAAAADGPGETGTTFPGLSVDVTGESLPFLSTCGTAKQHALTFSADTSAIVEVGEAASVEADGLALEVRNVQAMTFESNDNCEDASSGTQRSWLAVRQAE